eukprot:1580655-Ditylum_brightwellii.AAC.1
MGGRKIWFTVIVGDNVDKVDDMTISLLASSDDDIGLFLSSLNSCLICEAVRFAVAVCKGKDIYFYASTY